MGIREEGGRTEDTQEGKETNKNKQRGRSIGRRKKGDGKTLGTIDRRQKRGQVGSGGGRVKNECVRSEMEYKCERGLMNAKGRESEMEGK